MPATSAERMRKSREWYRLNRTEEQEKLRKAKVAQYMREYRKRKHEQAGYVQSTKRKKCEVERSEQNRVPQRRYLDDSACTELEQYLWDMPSTSTTSFKYSIPSTSTERSRKCRERQCLQLTEEQKQERKAAEAQRLREYRKRKREQEMSSGSTPRKSVTSPKDRQKWIHAKKRNDFIPSINDRIYSDDFSEDSFTIGRIKSEKKYEIPTAIDTFSGFESEIEKFPHEETEIKVEVVECSMASDGTDVSEHFTQQEDHEANTTSAVDASFYQQLFTVPLHLTSGTSSSNANNVDSPATIKCEHCNKEFKFHSTRTRHMNSVHNTKSKGSRRLYKVRKFSCSLCNKQYTRKETLMNHINSVHSTNELYRKYLCDKCDYQTALRSSLYNHIKSMHEKNRKRSDVGKVLLNNSYGQDHNTKIWSRVPQKQCPLCSYVSASFSNTDEMDMHFIVVHEIKVDKSVLIFETMEEFNCWKRDIEKSTVSKFIKKMTTNATTYYQCNRSGSPRQTPVKTNRKKPVSCKINAYCPAGIKVNCKQSKIIVTYVSTHVGHNNDIKHIRLSGDERRSIKKKRKCKKTEISCEATKCASFKQRKKQNQYTK